MASNKIVVLEHVKLEKMKRLAVLDVSNNNIAQMPPEIGLLTQLKYVFPRAIHDTTVDKLLKLHD
jgi:Leucine-rich repeat (LRR) protein